MRLKNVLSLILVGVFCLTLLSGCGEDKEQGSATTEITTQKSEKNIVLVGGNEGLGFYQNLKKGAEDAAKEYGFTLNYVGVDEETENIVSAHISSIEKIINNDLSGIVIVPAGEGYSQVYNRLFDAEIPVVQIDNLAEKDFENIEGNKKNPIVSVVMTAYEDAGKLCAEKFFEETKEDIKKSDTTFVIGVIERDGNVSDEEKRKGFVEKFSELADADSKIKDKYRIEAVSESEYEEAVSKLTEEKVKAVFITHPTIADKISDIVFADAEKYKDIKFCGFDSGAKQLKWLNTENGPEFIGAVAQDSYNLGYNAVEQCVFSIQGKEVKENVEISGKWYDKTNADKMKQDKIVYEK